MHADVADCGVANRINHPCYRQKKNYIGHKGGTPFVGWSINTGDQFHETKMEIFTFVHHSRLQSATSGPTMAPSLRAAGGLHMVAL